MARVPASYRGQISPCYTGFFMLQQMLQWDFFGCCNRCFCDVAVLLLEMLQYIFSNVEHTFFMLQYTFFDVAVYVFSMLQHMFFNVVVHIFSLL